MTSEIREYLHRDNRPVIGDILHLVGLSNNPYRLDEWTGQHGMRLTSVSRSGVPRVTWYLYAPPRSGVTDCWLEQKKYEPTQVGDKDDDI